jgi:hypothetical protein
MGSRLFTVTALLVFAIGLLSACAQNPSAEGVDASAAREEAQGNAEQPAEEPTLVEDPTPMPERTMATAAESDIGILAGGEPPPEYQVKKDGTLIIGGDVVVRCADLLKVAPQVGNPTPKARRQMRQRHKEHIAVCTRAGFPPEKPSQSP